jgi:L-fuconolactonase
MKIDSHQHFWKYDPVKEAWITPEMAIIQKDFMPQDLEPVLKQHNFEGCIAVQADQSENETHFLLELARENDFIKGVVGWVDFKAANIEERLDYFSGFKKLKGFRHILQAETNPEFMLQNDFCNGIKKLAKYNFTYDILIGSQQWPFVVQFIQKFPEQLFVIDHLAKPDFKQSDFSAFEKLVQTIAKNPNVFCKVSGLVTEAHWYNWKPEDFKTALDIVTENFSINRLMFGSDWPVCLLSASYPEVIALMENYFSSFSSPDQKALRGNNAVSFYNLEV